MPQGTTSLSNVGADEFRLRNFIETLIAADELEIVETPTELADLTWCVHIPVFLDSYYELYMPVLDLSVVHEQ